MTPQPPPGQPGFPAGPADEELFRDALRRTADTLPPLPDLVPEAVREGQRRRSRNRGLAVAGTFVAVTAVTLGIALLGPLVRPTPDTEPAAPPGPSLTRPTPEPSSTRPVPDPSPDPTEPVTGMPPHSPSSPPTATHTPSSPPTATHSPLSPPTATPSSTAAPSPSLPLWPQPPSPPSAAPPSPSSPPSTAGPEPARSAAEPYASTVAVPHPGATS